MSVKHNLGNGKKVRQETPMVVWLWVMVLGFGSYVVIRIALDGYPHPIHWAFGASGCVAGYFLGWLWYRWKGDVL
jgi:hypothetical protein